MSAPKITTTKAYTTSTMNPPFPSKVLLGAIKYSANRITALPSKTAKKINPYVSPKTCQ